MSNFWAELAGDIQRGRRGMRSKMLFSLIIALVAIAHISEKIRIDTIGLILLVLAMAPWVSSWIESIKLGDFEAKFRELKESVDETRRELDTIKATYQTMQDDYLASCAEFDPHAPLAALNALATTLKAKAKGLSSIDFMFSGLSLASDQSLVFGAACALQVRPQFQAMDSVLGFLQALAQTTDLKNLRLTTLYRLLKALDEILKLDSRNQNSLLSDAQKKLVVQTMTHLGEHPECCDDDVGKYAKRLAARL